MNDQELLLSDEFVEFSKEIAQIHEKKKAIEAEFKAFFENYKEHKKELEDKVAAASAKWENWKKAQSSSKK